jgi:hypothetical protein
MMLRKHHLSFLLLCLSEFSPSRGPFLVPFEMMRHEDHLSLFLLAVAVSGRDPKVPVTPHPPPFPSTQPLNPAHNLSVPSPVSLTPQGDEAVPGR